MDKFNKAAFSVSLLVSALSVASVQANPSGPTVVNGQVSFDATQPGVLNITNSPNAIINWQGFSIPAGEVTRFIQQNAASAVLNRVVGQDPSVILGQLLSNGQVFLINPNGVIFGQGSMVDTAGLLASTLNVTNEDFLRGNYLFVNPGPGKIENFGVIHVTNGGSVVLISPNIENNGLIQSDGGHLVLAAGERLTLTSMDAPQIRFEIQAPANKVINIGQLMAKGGGSIDIFADSIHSSGSISADSVQVDQQGRVNLIAQGDITLDGQSQTSANGASGGTVQIQSQNGTTHIAGNVAAVGTQGAGGKVDLLGRNVGLFDKARVDASGKTGGGAVRIGGDRQGRGATQRAEFTYVGQEAQVHADATTSGKGGSIITYANDVARIYGGLTARGGALSGNGGFIETSGKKGFEILSAPDVGVTNGLAGEWLIDPDNIDVVTSINSNITPTSASSAFTTTAGSATIAVSLIEASLSGGSSVTIAAGNNSTESGDIDWSASLDMSNTTSTGASLSLQASNHIRINSGGIINGSSKPLNLELWADTDGVNGGDVNYYNANLDLGAGWLHVLQGTNGDRGIFNLVNSNSITIDAAGGFVAGTVNAIQHSAPAIINAGSGFSADTLNISGIYTGIATNGAQQFSNPLTINGPVTVSALNTDGQLDSNDTITVNGAFDWQRGVIGGTGTALITNASTRINDSLIELTGNRVWTNNGTINWAGTANTDINLWDFATLQNKGLMNIATTDNKLDGKSSSSFLTNESTGVINVTGSVAFLTPFTNSGILHVDGGALDIAEGGGVDTGAYNLTNGGSLRFFDLTARQIDTLNVSSGNSPGSPLALSGPVTVNKLTLSGQLDSTSPITVNDTFDWHRGELIGSGATLTTNGTTTISGGSVDFAGSRIWINNGTINWAGNLADINLLGSATIQNHGLMNISTIGSQLTGTSNNHLTNESVGIINVSNRVGFLSPFSNNGTVNIKGGELTVYRSGADTGSYNLSNTGYLVFSDVNGQAISREISTINDTDLTGFVFFENGNFDISKQLNANWVVINDLSTVRYTGNYLSNRETLISGVFNVVGGYTQSSAGETFMNNGSLLATSVMINPGTTRFTLSDTYDVSLSNAGLFAGAGKVDLNGFTFTNSGGVALWGGPTTIIGDYVQTATGDLAIVTSSTYISPSGVANYTPGMLDISGSASVAGNLFVLSGSLGDSAYRVIETTAGLSGTFDTIFHRVADDSFYYTYDSTGITVTGLPDSVTEIKDNLIANDVTLVDEVFDSSTDEVIAMISSSDMSSGSGKAGGGEPTPTLKACKK